MHRQSSACRAAVSASLVLAAAASSALAQQYNLQHTNSITLGSVFNTGSAFGNNATGVAFDGTNIYVGGFNNGNTAPTVGVCKIENALAALPTITGLTNTQITANASRGIYSMAADASGNFYYTYDSGSNLTNEFRSYDSAGNQRWATINPFTVRCQAIAIDPNAGGTGVAELGAVGLSQGRRMSLRLSDGSVDYTIGGGANPGGIVTGVPTNYGNNWRAISFDSAGNIAMAGDGSIAGIQFGLRNAQNQWKTVDGATTDHTSNVVGQSPATFDTGRSVSILEGMGASKLLAWNSRSPGAFSATDNAGGVRNGLDSTHVFITNLNGDITGLTTTELNGTEDGIGSGWITDGGGNSPKFMSFARDVNGVPTLVIAGQLDRKVDIYQLEPTWNSAGGGDWTDNTKWLANGVPNGAAYNARFGAALGAPSTVTLNGDKTVRKLIFDNAFKYTIAGTDTLKLDSASTPSINVISGNHEISAPIALNKLTDVNIGGGLTLTASGGITATGRTLNMNGPGTLEIKKFDGGQIVMLGGRINVIANGTDNGASRVGTLDLGSNTFDLRDNDMLVAQTSLATIEGYIGTARNGGTWDQPGLTSSTAAAANPAITGLGAISGDDYLAIYGPGALFDGYSVVTGETVVKYTYNGDTDLNGAVDFDDYVRTDAGYNGVLTGWINGDFDYNNTVDFDDYVYIDAAYNSQGGTLVNAMNWLTGDDRSARNAAQPGVGKVIEHFNQFGLDYANAFIAAVPEPTSALILLGAIPMLGRRRRR